MSDFIDCIMCLLTGGLMDGQYVPIADHVNKIWMYTKGGSTVYQRINWHEFKVIK
jgi:hypothetical protein